MNEPKKRGRPSKAEIEARANARVEGGDVGLAHLIASMPTVAERMTFVPAAPEGRAQAYAMRVWEGQSESAPHNWRVQRVKEALEGQGLSMEGVVLP